jgi:hypothetical protein
VFAARGALYGAIMWEGVIPTEVMQAMESAQ